MASPTVSNPALFAAVAAAIRAGQIRRVVVLTGAGTSVASGIPDFRSPGGMYATLRPELLTASPSQRAAMSEDPTEVVSWSLFRENALPYLELRRPFILGTAAQAWQPTLAHAFCTASPQGHSLASLHPEHRRAGQIDSDRPGPRDQCARIAGSCVVRILWCRSRPRGLYSDAVRSQIRNIYGRAAQPGPAASSPILCAACSRPGVKPSTVLYGRDLPPAFSAAAACPDLGGAEEGRGRGRLGGAGPDAHRGDVAHGRPCKRAPAAPATGDPAAPVQRRAARGPPRGGALRGARRRGDGCVGARQLRRGLPRLCRGAGVGGGAAGDGGRGECPCCPASRACLGLSPLPLPVAPPPPPAATRRARSGHSVGGGGLGVSVRPHEACMTRTHRMRPIPSQLLGGPGPSGHVGGPSYSSRPKQRDLDDRGALGPPNVSLDYLSLFSNPTPQTPPLSWK